MLHYNLARQDRKASNQAESLDSVRVREIRKISLNATEYGCVAFIRTEACDEQLGVGMQKTKRGVGGSAEDQAPQHAEKNWAGLTLTPTTSGRFGSPSLKIRLLELLETEQQLGIDRSLVIRTIP